MPANTKLSLEEIARIAQEIYRTRIRPQVMPEHKGEFLALDIDTGDFEIDRDDLSAEDRLRARHPNLTGFIIRIGYQTAESLGGRLIEDE